MLKKFDFDIAGKEESKPARTKYGFGPCEVYGCPRQGHINSGVWNCRYHHARSGASLAQVTLTLRTHAREFDWYERMLNATPVDFMVGDIEKNAPPIFKVLSSDNFKTYRARVFQRIDSLLIPKSRATEIAP